MVQDSVERQEAIATGHREKARQLQ